MLFATIRGIWGCAAATAEKLRSLATGRNWNLVVLEMDATSEASAN
jgi:hypothetical protein